MDWKIFAIPLIGGLIGYLTNYIAVKMVFRPKKVTSLGPIKIQGLIPKRRSELAHSIANTVDKNLINSSDIVEQIKGIDIEGEFKSVINNKIDDFIETKLLSLHPMIGMFVNGEMKEKIRFIFIKELEDVLPTIYDIAGNKIEDSIDMHEIVYQKVESFSIDKLEEIIFSIAKKEMRAIEILGGVLGVIIGLIQVVIMRI